MINSQIDESIIAGYILKLGNVVVDSSLKSKLISLKRDLVVGGV